MKPLIQHRIPQILAVTALALGLAACGPNDGQTAGQKLDNSIERTEQAAEQARVDAERAVENAGQAVSNAADATRDAASTAAIATQDAASDAMQAAGEAGITARVKTGLIAEAEISALKIDVDTMGTEVRLTGEVPSESAKERAGAIAQAVQGVTSVKNELVVK